MTDLNISSYPLIDICTYYEDHEVGRVYDHSARRTLTFNDNVLFSTQMVAFHNLYTTNSSNSGKSFINPILLFDTAFGISVNDLSEGGGFFLGASDVQFVEPFKCGDTLRAKSEVIDARISKTHPDNGIVTWHTTGYNADGDLVISFNRTNFVRKRPNQTKPGYIARGEFSGFYEDFLRYPKFRHYRSRTITDLDLNGLTLLVMNTAAPHYSELAAPPTVGQRLNFGGLTLSLVIGLTYSDTANQLVRELGIRNLKLPNSVFLGDTLSVVTEVIDAKKKEGNGIISMRHIGYNQENVVVCDVVRDIEVRAES